MSDVNDKTLSKIRALLAKAEDPGATGPEAEAFLTKAAELMARYGVDRAMLAAADPTTDTVADKTIIVPGPYAMGRVTLLSAIGKALGVRSIRYIKQRGSARAARLGNSEEVRLFGMASDLQRLDILYTSLLVQCATSQARDERAGHMDPWVSPKKWRRDYMIGFAIRVRDRLIEAEATARRAYDDGHTGGPSTALVLRDRTALVNARLTATAGKLRPASSRHVTTGGFDRGDAAGQRADLGGTRIGSARRPLES